MAFPLPLETLLGKPLMFVVFGLIGFAFGYILEISGFGNSKKLAAQFYFTELTVLKVMFTAIVVAMVLIFIMVGLGVLDYNQIWVNPTYLWPGIVGGLIMGVGFIVGGFCPGTSLVSMATFKIDGLFFVLGGLAGIFLFGETVPLYEAWWNSSDYGRLTIQDWLNVPTGVVVVGVILMALFMFWGAEQLERIVGKRDLKKEPRLRVAAAGALFIGALVVLFIGDAGTAEKWGRISLEKEAALLIRQVQIHPGELLHSIGDDGLRLVMIDVRPEADYNLFHIEGARNVPMDRLLDLAKELQASYIPNQVVVLMSNDEVAATQAWKTLTAESVSNLYILEGGINNWLAVFSAFDPQITPTPNLPGEERIRFEFPAALGSRYEASFPDPHHWKIDYTPKIKLEVKRDKSGGGCG
jgi:rhodanese-related sulfurtransferase/uncharacterized membrane protein (DUF485 family)